MKKYYILFLPLVLGVLFGCGDNLHESVLDKSEPVKSEEASKAYEAEVPANEVPKEVPTQEIKEESQVEEVETIEEAEPSQSFSEEREVSDPLPANGHIVAIDAGHQAHGNFEKEPIGPGATEEKYKVAGGTSGKTSGLPEYELTLQVSLKLQEELETRGYTVIMIRTTNDVDISNAERAIIANDNNAEAFIRIHADGSENTSAKGATALCQTANNPYNGNLYEQSRSLSSKVLDGLVAATECNNRGITETDTMSGINWCQVPVTIIEIGFMTNPDEDLLMSTDDYQWKIAGGIADGIDNYFSN